MGKHRALYRVLSLLTIYRAKAYVHYNAFSDSYTLCGNNTLKNDYRLLHFDVVASDEHHLAKMPEIKKLIASAQGKKQALN